MRRFFYLLIFTCEAMLISQSAQSQSGPPATFFQMVDVSKYKGAMFTLECRMFATRLDPNSGTALIALSLDKGNQVGTAVGKLSMEDFKPGEWNKLILTGKIDKHADVLAVGALYSGKAKFLFDGMKLSVKGKGWEEIPLKNGDFEELDLSAWKFANTPGAVNISVTNQSAYSGKQALSIDASNVSTVGYGNNDKVGHYADINGNRIYYEVYGEGTPLLLLHGALESIQSFHEQIPALSASFKVIAVDTRGHGKSSADSTTLTYELYADDMYKLLNELKLDSINVLGWSDGGNTGMLLAMTHPEKVRKLAIMGANLFNDGTAIYDWVNDTIRSQIKELEQSNHAGKSFELRVKHTLLEQPHINPQSLKAIKCPVLVMAGEQDVVKQSHTKLIADNIPAAKLIIFKKATHEAPIEIPDKFNRTVISFFQQ